VKPGRKKAKTGEATALEQATLRTTARARLEAEQAEAKARAALEAAEIAARAANREVPVEPVPLKIELPPLGTPTGQALGGIERSLFSFDN
jgi:hypothetical protein